MEFLSEYGLFLAKAVTIVIAIAVVIGLLANLGQRKHKHHDGHIEITHLNEELDDVREGMLKEILSEEEYKERQKEKKKKEKAQAKERKKKLKASAKKDSRAETEDTSKGARQSENSGQSENSEDLQQAEKGAQADKGKRTFVIDFDGDVEASAVENLREEITAILGVAEKGDEVLLRLESPGGLVHAYGLAASQLTRIKQAGIRLVVAVDAVAASGGYMMACVADELISAPFAVVGSIGVVAELPNFHRLLKHNKVDYEQHTAGEYKRTLTMFSENTEAARQKFKQELEETHQLFKQFIRDNRPQLDVDKVATGEHWYGSQALALKLVDKIQTSDDYLLEAAKTRQLFEVKYEVKKPLVERLSISMQEATGKALLGLWQKSLQGRLFKS